MVSRWWCRWSARRCSGVWWGWSWVFWDLVRYYGVLGPKTAYDLVSTGRSPLNQLLPRLWECLEAEATTARLSRHLEFNTQSFATLTSRSDLWDTLVNSSPSPIARQSPISINHPLLRPPLDTAVATLVVPLDWFVSLKLCFKYRYNLL